MHYICPRTDARVMEYGLVILKKIIFANTNIQEKIKFDDKMVQKPLFCRCLIFFLKVKS